METENEGRIDNFEETQLLAEFKNRINENPNIAKFVELFDDEFLLCFIRGRKYNIHKAYKTMEGYISVRTEKNREHYRTLRPSTTVLNSGMFEILKNRDHLNRTVVVDRLKAWDLRLYSLEVCLKALTFVLDDLMRDNIPENGIVVIIDLDGYSFQHAKLVTPKVALQGVNMFINAMPVQYKELLVINEMRLFTVLHTIVRPFLPNKVKNRLHFYGNDLSALHQHVSPSILPKSLGGTLSEEEAFDNELENRIRSRENFYQKFAEKL